MVKTNWRRYCSYRHESSLHFSGENSSKWDMISESVNRQMKDAKISFIRSGRCTISFLRNPQRADKPDFSTGNGKVDLFLECEEKSGLIEVKSHLDMAMLKLSRLQAATYAKKSNLNSVTLALFVPTEDKAVLQQLLRTERVGDIDVIVYPVSWF